LFFLEKKVNKSNILPSDINFKYKYLLPTPFLDSLEGLPGFEKNAFAQVHAQGEQITSVRLNKYQPFNQAAHSFLNTA
jgi:hypothetical protein